MNSQEVTNYECPYRKSCSVTKDVNRCNTPRHLDCTIYQRVNNLERTFDELGIGTMVGEDISRLGGKR